MKIAPEQPEEMMGSYEPEPQYPFGTQVRLEDDLAIGVGYDKFKAGDVVEVRAKAFITRKGESADLDDAAKGESEKCIALQLTEISLTKATKDYVKQLYSESSSGEDD